MTVQLASGVFLDLDDLPSVTRWIQQHIAVTKTVVAEYDDGSSDLCLECSVTGTNDLYTDGVRSLTVYVDLANRLQGSRSEEDERLDWLQQWDERI